MRHRKASLKLGRTSSHRNAMFRNMVTSLFKHDRIQTTDAKAKELKRWADRLISLAKRGDLHARRQAMAVIREKDVVHKLFEEAPKRFGDISGGYTRVVKLGRRRGDAAPVSIIELITIEPVPKKKKPAQKTTKADAGKKPAVKEVPAEKAAQEAEAATAAPAKKKAATKKTAAAKEEKPVAKKSTPAKKTAKPKDKEDKAAEKKPAKKKAAPKRKPLTKAAEEKIPTAEEKSAKRATGKTKKAAPAKKADIAEKKPATKKKTAATTQKKDKSGE